MQQTQPAKVGSSGVGDDLLREQETLAQEITATVTWVNKETNKDNS